MDKGNAENSGQLGKAGSVKQAAAAMGVAVEVLKAAKNAGCPGFDDHHRVDMDLVRGWLKRPENEAAASGSPVVRKALADARKTEADAERAEFELEKERGEWVRVRDIDAELQKLAAGQKTILRQKLENEFPSSLAGKTIEQIRTACREVVDQVCALMQGLSNGWQTEEVKV